MSNSEKADTFGGMVRMLRRRAELTQENLAELTGASVQTIRSWERGAHSPSAFHLQNLIKGLMQKGGFFKGKELEEIQKLWDLDNETGLKGIIDKEWIAGLQKQYKLLSTRPSDIKADAQVDESLKRGEKRSVLENNDAPSYASEPFVSYQDRQNMLNQIESIWIKDILARLLQDIVKIELQLNEHPEVVDSPLKKYQHQYFQGEQQLPKEFADIWNAYEKAHHKLLILGEPGSGKTTLLLQLAQILLKRARKDTTHPIPVIFSLSSWAQERLSIKAWIIKELRDRYQIPLTLGTEWVEKRQILALFDGLDTVGQAYYGSCIEALNIYLQGNPGPTVICSRRNSYINPNQPKQLLLHSAVIVQQLSEKQIDMYMRGMVEQRKTFSDMFTNSSVLHTPLMLKVFIAAYKGMSMSVSSFANNPIEAQKQVLRAYILRMFKRRNPHADYNFQQTLQYLRWLAQQSYLQSEEHFYIEFMQFTWLPRHPLRTFYPAFAVALFYGLISGISYGILYLPFYPLSQVIIFSLCIALFNTLLYSTFNGVLFGVLADEEKETQTSQKWPAYSRIKQKVLAILGNRFVYGLLNGLCDGIFIGLMVNPVSGWLSGLFSFLFCTALGKQDKKIKCAGYLTWDWPSMLRNAYKFLAGGLFVGLLYGLVTGRDYLFIPTKLFPALLLGISVGLLLGLFTSIRGGFIDGKPDTHKILRPNQGIWRSLRNSLFFGSLFSILLGTLLGLIYGPILFLVLGNEYRNYFPANSGWIYGLSDGLVVAAFFWLVSGGIACIQHILLRFMLWRRNAIPWNYPSFLDRAVDLGLLFKLGGGYKFFHDQLREYFNAMDDSEMETLSNSSNEETHKSS